MCCYKYYLINFLLRFSLHVFAAFLELSTTPEANVAKKSTIELGYEIYQLRSAQCRNQGKILKCDFHVHEYNFLFFAKCTTVCFFSPKKSGTLHICLHWPQLSPNCILSCFGKFIY